MHRIVMVTYHLVYCILILNRLYTTMVEYFCSSLEVSSEYFFLFGNCFAFVQFRCRFELIDRSMISEDNIEYSYQTIVCVIDTSMNLETDLFEMNSIEKPTRDLPFNFELTFLRFSTSAFNRFISHSFDESFSLN